jgi:signal transduction histidine kinase
MEQAPAASKINTRLGTAWLLPARLLWLTGSLIALGLFLAGLPLHTREIHELYRGDIQTWLIQNQKGEVFLSPQVGSTAAQAGILEGDILLAVDGVEITSTGQADELLTGEIGAPVTVSVRTGNFPARQVTVTRGSWAGGILLEYGLSSQFAVTFALASELLLAVLCVGIAAVIVRHRSDDWMALFSALWMIVLLTGLSLPVVALANSLFSGSYPYWMDAWIAFGFGLLILFFYLFPAGRFASNLTLGLTLVLGLWLTLGLFERSLLIWYLPRVLYISAAVFWITTGVVALIHRYQIGDSFQRQQIRWIVWGAIASVVGLMLQILPTVFNLNATARVIHDFLLYPLGQLLKACLPLSIAFAILRYRLWNIELILNRVLVYGSLSVLTMLGYLGAIFVLHVVFTGLSNPVISFLAAGTVAILFEPLRQRLQRAVNRWMYGERDDPYAVLSRLVGTLERTPSTNEVLPAIAETIGHSLKIPYVAIWLDQDGEEKLVASSGSETTDLVSFPLTYQGETIGRLEVARRSPNEQFSEADYRLIENIAQQAGAAAQTVRLNAELIRSRAQIVNEREDERLRIRRDLHDELGPMLAAQGLKLSAARQVIRTKPEKAESLVDEVIQQSRQTVADVRRLVHGLRPPVLDQLGLIDAVRDLARNHGGSPALEIVAPSAGLPHLPAAVEVNAYRILLEAWNNAVRHAHASRCLVKFLVEENMLAISIQDDGTGMPKEYRAGVGLRSMRARAEEIGGHLSVDEVQPHGTRITARLPLSSQGGHTK